MNKAQANTQLMDEMEKLQSFLTDQWIDLSLPDDWSGLDASDPVVRHKTRVTIRLDSDMVRWFRKLGPGYGARINQVLRIYWAALLSGRIQAHWEADDTSPRFAAYLNKQIEELRASSEARRKGEG